MTDARSPTVEFVVMGNDGFYTFVSSWEDLPYRLGELRSWGFTLIGIDGINGFRVNPPGGEKDGRDE